jgi:hypothetical protein
LSGVSILSVDRLPPWRRFGNALVGAGALPVAEEFGDELLHLRGIELAADDDFALAGAVELLVELARFVERDLLQSSICSSMVETYRTSPRGYGRSSGGSFQRGQGGFGSVLPLSALAMRCWRICSNSASGNEGSRRSSR